MEFFKRKKNKDEGADVAKTSAKQNEISNVDMIRELKEDIVEEIRLVAKGAKSSVFEAIELGEKLIELERKIQSKGEPRSEADGASLSDF